MFKFFLIYFVFFYSIFAASYVIEPKTDGFNGEYYIISKKIKDVSEYTKQHVLKIGNFKSGGFVSLKNIEHSQFGSSFGDQDVVNVNQTHTETQNNDVSNHSNEFYVIAKKLINEY